MSERASSQIADSVTQAGSAVLGDGTGVAIGQSYLAGTQGAAMLYANLVADQQQHMLSSQAATNAAVQRFLGTTPAPPPRAGGPLGGGDAEEDLAGGLGNDLLADDVEAAVGREATADRAAGGNREARPTQFDVLGDGGPAGDGPAGDGAEQGPPAAPGPGGRQAPAKEAPGGEALTDEALAAAQAALANGTTLNEQELERLHQTIDRLIESLCGFVGRSPVVY